MATTQIGALVVDLSLKFAKFSSDLEKVSGQVSTTSNRIQRTFSAMGTAVASVLTVRMIRALERTVEQSLKLAATLDNDFGRAARKFMQEAEAMSNAFQLGVAKGFMDAVTAGGMDSAASLENLAKVGIAVGNALGRAFVEIANLFTVDIPNGVTQSIESLNSLISGVNGVVSAFNQANEAVNEFFGTDKTFGNLPTLPTIDVSSVQGATLAWVDLGDALTIAGAASRLAAGDLDGLSRQLEQQKELLAAAAQGSLAYDALKIKTDAYNASLKAGIDLSSAQGQEWLNNTVQIATFQNQIGQVSALFEKTRTPLEAYSLEIERLNALHRSGAINAELFARGITTANASVVGAYLNGLQQATGALAGAFQENKAIQIANAVVNTAAGVTKALGDPLLPFPLDFAVAGSIAAAGAAQIAAIASAHPGGGSVPRVSGGGGKVAKGGGDSGANASQGQRPPKQAVTIVLQGQGGFTRDQVRSLAGQLGELVADGATTIRTA